MMPNVMMAIEGMVRRHYVARLIDMGLLDEWSAPVFLEGFFSEDHMSELRQKIHHLHMETLKRGVEDEIVKLIDREVMDYVRGMVDPMTWFMAQVPE
jgi:hypothetical protein